MQRAIMLLILLGLIFPALAMAEHKRESEAEKQKKAEEALRLEAKALAETIADNKNVSLHGTFYALKDQANDDKPLPKVIGRLAADGVLYPVIVAQPAGLKLLLTLNAQDVSINGKILDKGEQGKFLIVTTVIVPAPNPQSKSKRGGL